MKEIFVKTCGLHSGNIVRLAEELRKWLPHASVYVQMNPRRLVVCRGSTATVINEGDVFSLVQRHNFSHGMINEIVNHTEKRDTVKVTIGDREFLIETFVAEVVGDTENMKFRLTCLNNPEDSEDFDDYASLSNRINEHLWYLVDKRLLII